jgi:two-component system sensor histidine kinase RegB
VRIQISDDGPGFSSESLAKIGEPYISTHSADRRAKVEEGGLGLGLFIAKTLLERSGAVVSMGNTEPPLAGATIAVVWPRLAFESSPPPHEPDALEKTRA